ncbi:GNAT family N-acetyltransferase [Pinirhizobacter soli]|uniref:GNAT family N-acetyltransferase n=1 Tax=Pinirhizobacter soli TaxID=2786953 RepID=UPI00202A2AFC|nr:GNAT family N-acetyltransferase [Pinirhizobacter soli]
MDKPTIDIVHKRREQVFEAVVDGAHCVLDYQLSGNIMTIMHTGVPDVVGGRGIAGALTLAAFQAARSEGWKVTPACSYAAGWIERHPEFADLQA